MARNSLSPGYVKFNYFANAHPHLMTVPVNPIAPAGAATQLTDSGGGTQLWTSFVADWVLLMKALLNTADSIVLAEMWTQATPTSVPLFQATTAIGVAGTGSTPAIALSQYRQSFRTKAGGRGVFMMMETIAAIDTKLRAPGYSSFAPSLAIDAYLTGSSSCAWGRDNAYMGAGIQVVTKINDKLRKKYFNP